MTWLATLFSPPLPLQPSHHEYNDDRTFHLAAVELEGDNSEVNRFAETIYCQSVALTGCELMAKQYALIFHNRKLQFNFYLLWLDR